LKTASCTLPTVYYAGAAIRADPPLPMGRPMWDEALSTLAITITIAGVAARVHGGPSPWLHGALLAVVAFALPRLFLKRLLARACVGCPDSGRGSMALLVILGAMATEQLLMWMAAPTAAE